MQNTQLSSGSQVRILVSLVLVSVLIPLFFEAVQQVNNYVDRKHLIRGMIDSPSYHSHMMGHDEKWKVSTAKLQETLDNFNPLFMRRFSTQAFWSRILRQMLMVFLGTLFVCIVTFRVLERHAETEA